MHTAHPHYAIISGETKKPVSRLVPILHTFEAWHAAQFLPVPPLSMINPHQLADPQFPWGCPPQTLAILRSPHSDEGPASRVQLAGPAEEVASHAG